MVIKMFINLRRGMNEKSKNFNKRKYKKVPKKKSQS